MATTEKIITVALTKQDKEILDILKDKLNNTTSDIIKRALNLYYTTIIQSKSKKIK